MDIVVMARVLFGSSMGFHIIYATIGVGLPIMIILAEVMYWIKKDEHYALMAKRWTKGFAILLAVSIASGTIVAVLLSLLFPNFMEIVGQVISLPFQLEIFAFLIEAVFMSIYLYAADRLPQGLRVLSITLVAMGATASAILITDVHAWMNTPAGFDISEDGTITNVNVWNAFFNPSFGVTAIHVTLSAYMTVAFLIASIAAIRLMKRHLSSEERSYHKKALMIALYFGAAMSLATAINGHETAQMLHEENPRKLAAAEGLFETTRYAGLSIGGYTSLEDQEVKYAIEIPNALSFLAGDRFDTEVIGLNEYPEELWPPLYVHILFNIMVGIGTLLIVLSLAALFWKHVLKREFPGWMLALLVVSGPLAVIAIEAGWCFSCIGRQPWTITDVLPTAEAATGSSSVGILLISFLTLYVVLLFVTGFVMRYYFKRNPMEQELTAGNG
ncbi:putative cytochrome bd menaquinol oxidase subunit I [Halobacillus andaensis]|uniref:Cytochrome bd menaquinol oxidase subunit I n=1 Tax=Halobacillus andaensis TaxID=1176239 RepID=A0A917BAR9_HALAA|nr:cytochrome ubiquinol oxidase subunit I [Halobacillus andaensis]MBP2006328.1 cytochrome d ubiquinol oxidase subunit I [Halobacillus andaensis]GGF34301.1 putative cytochrome bd menaquinol oxidase subunit I [Halobacillus andaensis]